MPAWSGWGWGQPQPQTFVTGWGKGSPPSGGNMKGQSSPIPAFSGKGMGTGGGPSFPKGGNAFAAMTMSSPGGDISGLVNRVKAVQKTEQGNLMWTAYLERNTSSKRDPSRHNAQFLQDFLSEADQGGACGGASGGAFGGAYVGFVGGGQDQNMSELVAAVKHGQRCSEQFKEAWSQFLASHDTSKRDPAKHDPAFLAKFLSVAPEVPADAGTRSQNTLPPPEIQDDQHQEIINRVKYGQRTSMEFKEAWIAYVREFGGDLRDPARHDPTFLETFLSTAPVVSEAPKEEVVDDEEHQALVMQIKEKQRASEVFKEAWGKYVQPFGNVRDPHKHSTGFLMRFLQSGLTGEDYGCMRPGKGFGKGAKAFRMSPY